MSPSVTCQCNSDSEEDSKSITNYEDHDGHDVLSSVSYKQEVTSRLILNRALIVQPASNGGVTAFI